MDRPSRIVVPLVILVAVAVWWMSHESPIAPNSSPEPVSEARGPRELPAQHVGQNFTQTADNSNPPVKTAASSVTTPLNDPVPRPAQFGWDGPTTVRGGVPFAVTLRMTSDDPVRVARMQLQFDPNLLEVVSVQPGQYLRSENFGYSVTPNGFIRIGATKETPTVLADAPLVIITFKPTTTSAGTAEVRFSTLHPEGSKNMIAFENLTPFATLILP